MKSIIQDRCRGALIGLAIGDALGTTNEFKRTEDVTPISTIVGGGPFNLLPGQWTDDTSMALCLAESLISNGDDPADQLDNYVAWANEGYMSSNGRCFDIGAITYQAINNYTETRNPLGGLCGIRDSGNGGIMRLAPSVIYHSNSLDRAIVSAILQSSTTHANMECREAAALLAEILFLAIHGDITYKHIPIRQKFSAAGIQRIADLEYETMPMHCVFHSGGYVVSTLEFALWCFYNSNSFAECVLLAANAGGDADTNAAVAGQIAGAYYGYQSIPQEWKDILHWHDEILRMADQLFDR